MVVAIALLVQQSLKNSDLVSANCLTAFVKNSDFNAATAARKRCSPFSLPIVLPLANLLHPSALPVYQISSPSFLEGRLQRGKDQGIAHRTKAYFVARLYLPF